MMQSLAKVLEVVWRLLRRVLGADAFDRWYHARQQRLNDEVLAEWEQVRKGREEAGQ